MSDLFGGLFSGAIDDIPEEIEGGQYERPKDGVYEATVTDIYNLEGTKNYPDRKWILVEYTIEENGLQITDWFQMPDDPESPTDAEKKKLYYFVNRLQDLGVPRDQINNFDRDSLIDTRVVITVKTKGQYQNVSNCELLEIPEVPQKAAAPARTAPVAGRRANPFSGK